MNSFDDYIGTGHTYEMPMSLGQKIMFPVIVLVVALICAWLA